MKLSARTAATRTAAALPPRPCARPPAAGMCVLHPAEVLRPLVDSKVRARPTGAAARASAQPSQPQDPERAPPHPLESVEEAPLIAGHRFNFADVYYYVNVVYWTLLLASLLTGNPLLERISHFENFVTAMFGCSVAFTGYFAARWVQDAKKQLQGEQRRDARGLLRFGWKAIFWLAFVLWYVGPQYEFFTDWCATAGGVACLSGLALVVSGALTVGEWSFMGEPQIPRHLATGGPYALLRHPQALGNILFLVGFSAAGGAVLAAATFLASFALYCRAVVPKEEAMLEAHFGESYRRYKERVPAFGYALVLLLLVEVILIWRFAPFSLPVGPIVPRPLT